MSQKIDLTPETIKNWFEKAGDKVEVGYQVINAFTNLSEEEKGAYLDPMIQFLEITEKDKVRSWGANILEKIGGDRAFESVLGVFKETDTSEIKKKYPYTRLFALRAANSMALTDEKKGRLKVVASKICRDEEEWELPRVAAAAILARNQQKEATEWIKGMLEKYQNKFWKGYYILRALMEFPLDDLREEVIKVAESSKYLDYKFLAIQILGKQEFRDDIKVVDRLGSIATQERNIFLRCSAIDSLSNLKNKSARDELLEALKDPNAEVRLRASLALQHILTSEGAVSAIVNSALEPENTPQLVYFIDSIRHVDPDREISTKVLSDEMENPDQERAKQAKNILIELGGWAAITRLSQRSRNLDRLSELLKKSEDNVTESYKHIMKQAHVGFYFSMGVNVVIVITGIALIGIALQNLIQNPGELAATIVPGGGGALGLIYSAYLNDPRKNAKQDLASFLNVSIIFQGYLQELHHIDATFSHMYIENQKFGTNEMERTVGQITKAAEQTLKQVKDTIYPPFEKTGQNPSNGE